ncbi:MAG: hypothetical protein K2Q22_07340, partial [Cytophagales bacterium]|nr:hypothetical protein [Cytophagales bacterium]
TVPGTLAPGNGYLIRLSTSYPTYAPTAVQPIAIRSGALVLSSITGSLGACFNDNGRTFSVASLSGFNYQWTSPANSTISGSSTNAQVNIKFQSYVSPGTLKVRQTNAQGCFADVQTTISPLPLPVTPPIIGPTTVCGNAINVGYTVPGGALSTYAWSSTNSGIFISGTTSSTSANFNFSSPSSISVVETDNYGCVGAPVSMTIYAWAVPTPATISGVNAVCRNTGSLLYKITSTPGISISWSSPTNSSITGLNSLATANISFSNYTTTGNIIATQTNGFGCFVQSNYPVTALPFPITSAISGPSGLCANATGVGYSIQPSNSTTTANWTVNLPYTNLFKNATVVSFNVNNMVNPGSIQVIETNQFGCSGNPSIISITALTVPSTPSILGTQTICGHDQNVPYAVSSPNPNSTYIWTLPRQIPFTTGTSTSSSINLNFNYFVNSYGDALKVQEKNSFGCLSNVATLNLYPQITPEPSLINGYPFVIVCSTANIINLNTSVYYDYNSSGNTYTWDIPSNAVEVNNRTTSLSVNLLFKNYSNGTIKFTAKNKYTGCQNIQTLTVIGIPDPIITGPPTVCLSSPASSTFTFDGSSFGSSTFTWLPTSNLLYSSGSQATFSSFKSISDSIITVRINSKNGCNKEIKKIIPFTKSPRIPTLIGPTQVCLGTTTVNYSLSNINKGYYYQWQFDGAPMQMKSYNDSSVVLDVRQIIINSSASTISVLEISTANFCTVSKPAISIVGYPIHYDIK